jgi:ABC-type uncharacterized transport system substrate-binding protein
VAIEYRFAERRFDQLPALAADLVRRQVAVIVASGGDASPRAAKTATDAIPIVFSVGGDPVATGFVASLARPGGNATGVTLMTATLELKRLEILREVVPSLSTVALLADEGVAERSVRQGSIPYPITFRWPHGTRPRISRRIPAALPY